MNDKYFLIAIFSCLLFFQIACSKKIKYNIPPNYPEGKRNELRAILDKGKILYKTNCSDCHGIFTKGKDNIPNFTNTQIDNYSARFLRRDPKNHAVLRNMSPEQMEDVLLFLRYKRPKNSDSVVTLKRNRF